MNYIDYDIKSMKMWKKSINDLINYSKRKLHDVKHIKHIIVYEKLLSLAWSTNPQLVISSTVDNIEMAIDPVMTNDESFLYNLKEEDLESIAKEVEDGDQHLSMLPLVQDLWKSMDERPQVKKKIRLYIKAVVVRTVLMSKKQELLDMVNKHYSADKQLTFQ